MSDPIERLEELAREALADGKIKSAKARLKEMQSAAPEDARTIELAGDVALEAGDYKGARAAYQRLCEETRDPEVRGLGEHSLGLLNLGLEEWDAARKHLTSATRLYCEAGAKRRLKAALFELGVLDAKLGELQVAAETFRRLLAEQGAVDFEDEEDVLQDAEALRELGDVLRLQGHLGEAEAAFRDALTRYEAVEEQLGKSACLNGLGVVMQVAGRYDEAHALHREALAISEAEDDLEGLSANYSNLAMLCLHRKDWDAAEGWVRRSLAVDEELDDEDGIATAHLQLSMIQIERKDYAAAEKHLKKARKYFDAHGSPVDKLAVVSNYGELHLRQGKLDEAETELQQVLQMAEEIGHGDGIAKANDQMAELRKAQGRLNEARALWELSLSQYEALGSPAIVSEIKANLASLT